MFTPINFNLILNIGLGFLCGAGIIGLYCQKKYFKQKELLQETIALLREKNSSLEIYHQESERYHQEKLVLLEESKKQLKFEFQQLAAQILEEKSERFTLQNKNNLEGLLNPLREQIKTFEQKVSDTYDKESRDRFSLVREIHQLKELNQRMADDAVQLTRALKGESKTQGIWGEIVLERVLERSGLNKGSEYEVQVSLQSAEGGRSQPDVIVRLPDNKDIVVDAKVSLNAYERFCASSDPTAQALALQEHMNSLRTHVRSLSEKDYHQLKEIRTLDFVLMFIPIESAFMLAMQHDPQLFNDALQRNIILVTPTTLLTTLRTIQNMWRFEYQNQHAIEIAKKAGLLYDKFVALVQDLEEIGRHIQATQKAHDLACNKLYTGRGNLIQRVETLKTLGANTSKKLGDKWLEKASISAEETADNSIENAK